MSVTDDVYRRMLAGLLDGTYAPGQLLDRRTLAQQLGVSSTPVLETTLRLAHEGFLEIIPRKGTRVRVASDDDLRGHLLLREAIECQAARLICGQTVRDAHQRLLPLAVQADSMDGERINRHQADASFHLELLNLTGHPVFADTHRRIVSLGHFFEVARRTPPESLKIDSHVALLKVLSHAQPQDAEEAMRRHIREGKQAFLEQFTRVPSAPVPAMVHHANSPSGKKIK